MHTRHRAPPHSRYVAVLNHHPTGKEEEEEEGDEYGGCCPSCSCIPWPSLTTLNAVAMVSHFLMAWAVLGVCIWKDAAHKCVPITNTFNIGRPAGYGNTSSYETLPGSGICYGYLAFAFELVCFFAHWWVWWYDTDYVQQIIPSMVNPWRWNEYALSASLMVISVAVVSGSHSLGAVLGFVGCNVGTMYTGQWSEMVNRKDVALERWVDRREISDKPTQPEWVKSAKSTWTPFVVGCVLQAFVWTGIFASYGASVSRQQDPPVPWFVHAFVVQLFVAFNSFALVEALWLGTNWIKTYKDKEWHYMFLSLSSKMILSSFVVGSVM